MTRSRLLKHLPSRYCIVVGMDPVLDKLGHQQSEIQTSLVAVKFMLWIPCIASLTATRVQGEQLTYMKELSCASD